MAAFMDTEATVASAEVIDTEVKTLIPDIPDDIKDAVVEYVKGKLTEVAERKKYEFWTVWYADHRKDNVGPFLEIKDFRRIFEMIFGPLQRPPAQ